VDTSGYAGKNMSKGATIYTNDPVRPIVSATMTGPVERFATVRPERVMLRGQAGAPLSQTVEIIPEGKYPFSIVKASARNGRNIHFELSERNGEPGGGWRLTVENRLQQKGRYYDVIALATDSEIRPEIQVAVTGFIVGEKRPTRKPSASHAN
jgi:hypothetical protein